MPRIRMHDRKLARALRSSASAAPLHVSADESEQAHMAEARVQVMLSVAQAWGYMHDDDIAEAQNTARLLHEAAAPQPRAGRGSLTHRRKRFASAVYPAGRC